MDIYEIRQSERLALVQHVAQLQARNEALTAERNAALDEARKATARADDAERDCASLRMASGLPRPRDIDRIAGLEEERERLRAREGELVAALAAADQATVDIVTEERLLLSAECERLRAALREVRDWFWHVAGQDKNEWVQKLDAALAGAPAPAEPCVYCDGRGRCPNGGLCIPCEGDGAETVLHAVLSEVSAIAESTDDTMDVTAALREVVQRAAAKPPVTREQVEREIADAMDRAYATVMADYTRPGHKPIGYDEGMCDTLDAWSASIRSGAYRKTSEAAPAAAQSDEHETSETSLGVTAPASPSGVAEDRSEPPRYRERCPGGSRCLQGCLSREPCFYGAEAEDRSEPSPGYDLTCLVKDDGELEWEVSITPERLRTRAQAVAACWAHRDAVVAGAAPGSAGALRLELADARKLIAGLEGRMAEISVLTDAAIAALEGKP